MQARREADWERRVDNFTKESPAQHIRRRLREGADWAKITSGLNRDYPPPDPSSPWSVYTVVVTDSYRKNWGVPVEVVAEMRLEKYYTGEWLTIHPLQLFDIKEDDVVSIGSLQEAWWEDREVESED